VDYLADSLAQLGVGHVFGVGGANIEDVYDALHRTGGGVIGILAKHEFSATTMADGYARTSNRLGVVAATSGGGAMNLVGGLAEAFTSRVPMLALVGQPPLSLGGQGAFQETSGLAGSIDAEQLFSSFTRFCARVNDAVSFPEILARAVTAARGGAGAPGGPAVLLLPKDIQQSVLDNPIPLRKLLAPEPAVAVDEQIRSKALEALELARKSPGGVLLIAGDGVARANARAELGQLAHALDAQVALAPGAKDVFDNYHPRYLGVAGVMGHPVVARTLKQVAAVVLVGTRLPMVARGGLDADLVGKLLICFDSEPPYVASTIDIRGDLRTELAVMAETLGADRPLLTRLPSNQRRGTRPQNTVPTGPELLPVSEHSGQGIAYRDAVEAIEKVLPESSSIFVDAGNAGAAAVHQLRVPADGRFVVALGMGAMGYTFGAGMGAAFATGRRSYVIAGDGAFYMHGMEVHTAVEHDLPVTFVVFNNNAHGMCLTREQLYYDADYSYSRFKKTNLAAGMAAMFPTLNARHVETVEDLHAALVDANATNSPAFISVNCDADEIPPFVPFLQETQ
jgi:acetolactate synthase-1/2/3 large subunit